MSNTTRTATEQKIDNARIDFDAKATETRARFEREASHEDSSEKQRLLLINLKNHEARLVKLANADERVLKTIVQHMSDDTATLSSFALYALDKIVNIAKACTYSDTKLNKTLYVAVKRMQRSAIDRRELVRVYQSAHYSAATASSQASTTLKSLQAMRIIKRAENSSDTFELCDTKRAQAFIDLCVKQ